MKETLKKLWHRLFPGKKDVAASEAAEIPAPPLGPDPWAQLAHEVEFIGGPLCGRHMIHPAANYIQRCREDPHGYYQFNGLAYHWVPSARPNQIGPISDER